MKAGELALSLFLVTLLVFVEAPLSQESGNKAVVAKLRVGVLPDVSHEVIQKRNLALFQYLTEETGINIQYIKVDKYNDLLEAFHEKNIDLAWFGGYTFAKAHLQDKAIPLVMRDVDLKFTSYFLVKANHPANSISDFKNKVLAFGSRFSTSGYLMPRYFLSQENIIPEKFFSEIRYSGKHDTTVKWVRDGTVDLGVANSKVTHKILNESVFTQNEIRVLWETPKYSNYVWAAHPSVDRPTLIKIRDAFLRLSIENPKHKKILDQWGAHHFLTASIEDFLIIQKIAKDLTSE
jgi:phosphonate transport system substrate-binding protein